MLQEAKQAAAAASPEDPRMQQSSAEIKKVEKSLTALEKQIAGVDAEIADLKKSGAPKVWLDEVAELRKEKEQLRRKEEQLRKEKELLQEERLILMRRADA